MGTVLIRPVCPGVYRVTGWARDQIVADGEMTRRAAAGVVEWFGVDPDEVLDDVDAGNTVELND